MGYTYHTAAWVEGVHGEKTIWELATARGEVAF